MLVGENLHLDVARLAQVALHVTFGSAEVAARLTLGALEGVVGAFGPLDDLHAPSATAVGGLDRDGPSDLLSERHDIAGALEALAKSVFSEKKP